MTPEITKYLKDFINPIEIGLSSLKVIAHVYNMFRVRVIKILCCVSFISTDNLFCHFTYLLRASIICVHLILKYDRVIPSAGYSSKTLLCHIVHVLCSFGVKKHLFQPFC